MKTYYNQSLEPIDGVKIHTVLDLVSLGYEDEVSGLIEDVLNLQSKDIEDMVYAKLLKEEGTGKVCIGKIGKAEIDSWNGYFGGR